MKNVIVNAEYERVLFSEFSGSISQDLVLKTRAARQYLFYFINKNPDLRLISYFDMSNQSSDYLQANGVKLPSFVKDTAGENWYGQLLNKELEQKLNSKLFSYELLSQYGALPKEFHIVSTSHEIEEILKKSNVKKWILKSPYFCGGLGIKILENFSDIPQGLSYVHILEPYLERIIDMAVHFDPLTGMSFPYVSLIKPNGTYLGGKIYSTQETMDFELKQNGLYEAFYQNVDLAQRLITELQKFDLKQPVTIDSFIYRENGEIKSYPMCEINYRISMGTLNEGLKAFIPEDGVGLLLSLKPKAGINWQTILPYSASEKTGVLSLNDGNPHETALLISAKNLNILNRYKRIVLDNE